jgi:hypothetical protein
MNPQQPNGPGRIVLQVQHINIMSIFWSFDSNGTLNILQVAVVTVFSDLGNIMNGTHLGINSFTQRSQLSSQCLVTFYQDPRSILNVQSTFR